MEHTFKLKIYKLLLTSFVFFIGLFSYSQENCFNEIDDDGDGFIDFFDSDCDCDTVNKNNYYYKCASGLNNCAYIPDPQIGIQLKWHAVKENYGGRVVPLSGDLDGDGDVEIVAQGTSHLTIFDAYTGAEVQSIATPARYMDISAPAIADVDRDGYSEIFIAADYTIQCYKNTGSGYTLYWSDTISQQHRTPSITDFDNDGIPELLFGNIIVDALTGVTIAEGGNTATFAKGKGTGNGAWPIAADVLPNSYCVSCTGKEIVAGNQVYSVVIDRAGGFANASIQVEVQIPYADGRTSIADIDKDGDLDGIIATGNAIYVWDLQTPNLLAPLISGQYKSNANIGDFNKDGVIDMGIVGNNIYTVLTYNNGILDILWSIVTTDGSGMTGSTLFDFDADGSQELVYRDETKLRIIAGATGVDIITIDCTSGTRNEYPIIADIDNDDQSEIVCACGNGISVFKTDGSSVWSPSRQVWNQHSYYNVNINDNLTVPKYQQNHGIIEDSVKMNTFLTQYSSPQFIRPNIDLGFIDSICIGDSIALSYSVCNNQSVVYSGYPVSLFIGSPIGASSSPILTAYTTKDLIPDSCEYITFTIAKSQLIDTAFVIANIDTGSVTIAKLDSLPYAKDKECSYLDNMQTFYQEFVYTLQTKDITCYGLANGEIAISSTHNYTYSLDSGAYTSSGIFTNLVADTFLLLIRNSIGCIIDTTVQLTQPDTLETTFSQKNISCNGLSDGVITATTIGGTLPYLYSVDNGLTFQVNNVFSNLSAGTYNLVIKDSNNCQNTEQITLTEPPVFSFSLGNDTCIRNAITIVPNKENGISPFTYRWFDDPLYMHLISTDSIVDTTLNTDVRYRLIISDSNNCSDTSQVSINIIPTVDFYVDTNENCDPTPFLFTNISTYQNPFMCIWNFGDGETRNDCSSEILKQYPSIGVYDVSLTVIENNGCSDSIVKTNYVESKIQPIAKYDYFPKELLSTIKNKVSFINESQNSTNYKWYINQVLVDSSQDLMYELEDNVSHQYQVCLYMDENGCIDEYCQQIVLTPDVMIYLPNTFSPNGDNINDVFIPIVNGRIDIELETFIVLNKWGEEVFKTNSIEKGWDGANAKQETYVWLINYKIKGVSESFAARGHVTVIK